jgi:hypothetical protein
MLLRNPAVGANEIADATADELAAQFADEHAQVTIYFSITLHFITSYYKIRVE